MTRAPILELLAAAAICAGCLALDDGPTDTALPSVSSPPVVTPQPRGATELVVAVPGDPERSLPPADDETSDLLGTLLYDPLYRLDPSLSPVPALAVDLPDVSEDGRTWRVAVRSGGTSHGGQTIRAADVAFTLQLAASPSCPFGRPTCGAAAGHLASVSVEEGGVVALTLRDAWAPFLARVLGRLPVLSERAVRDATEGMVEDASDLDAAELEERVGRIAEDTNADRCLVEVPPTGCRLGDYADELGGLLEAGGVTPPPRERFTRVDGEVDVEAYGAALLEAVGALASVLRSEGVDRLAAAVPLIDVARHPLGGGPFRLERYRPGQEIVLRRHDGHVPERATLERVRLVVERDPSVATTALRGGELDWVLDLDARLAAGLATETGLRVLGHPLPTVWSIVFNVRPGRAFAEPVTRRAFASCLDRDALVAASTTGMGIPAVVETAPASWALSRSAPPPPSDPAGAAAELAAEGWDRGDDGIVAKGDVRLSGEVYVRPSRTELLAFVGAAADALRRCGIELVVHEADLAGDVLLEQLQWPNEFETVLVSRPLDVDPDTDFQAFESAHATSAEVPADSNPGGYRSGLVDALLAQAREAAGVAERTSLYGRVVGQFTEEPPSYPMWYETGHAALAQRVSGPDGAVDLAQPRYWWDAWRWTIKEP